MCVCVCVCERERERERVFHYTTLHSTALHMCIPLHYTVHHTKELCACDHTTLHKCTFHCIALHSTTLQCSTALHYISTTPLHCIPPTSTAITTFFTCGISIHGRCHDLPCLNTELFHTFSPDQLNGSVTQLKRKTRSNHCSRQSG